MITKSNILELKEPNLSIPINLDNIDNDIIPIIKDNHIEEVDLNKIDKLENLLLESKNLIGKVKPSKIKSSKHKPSNDDELSEEIEITNNFSEYHSKIMGWEQLLVTDYSNDELRVTNFRGERFVINEDRIIKIILTTPSPKKFCFKNKWSLKNVTPLSTLARILYNKEFKTERELLGFFLKGNVDINEVDIEMNLYSTYIRLSTLITSNGYWKYFKKEINKENIINSYKNGILSFDKCLDIYNNKKVEIEKLSESMSLNITSDIKFLESVYNNTEEISFDLGSIEATEDIYIFELYHNINIYRSLLESTNNLNLNKNGVVKSNYTLTENWIDETKDIIKIKINDLYFNALAQVLEDKTLLPFADGKGFIKVLMERANQNASKESIYILENFIKAYVHLGKFDVKEFYNYFIIEYNYISSEEELNTLNDIFSDKLSELKEQIDFYLERDKPRFKTTIITHTPITPLEIAINEKIRAFEIALLESIDEYMEDFNNANKEKISFLCVDKEGMCLIVDKKADLAVLERLTVIIPDVYNQVLKFTKCYSIIDKIEFKN